jgi:hypothetical protein
MADTMIQATGPQVNFVKVLLAERVIDDVDWAEEIAAKIDENKLSKKDASQVIDKLINAKRIPKDPVLQSVLSSIPKSKYAIPTSELDVFVEEKVNGDLLFVEVKEYMNILYMRKLLGAPGGFTRTKLSVSDVKEIVNIIAADPVKYARIFGEHYSCCGKCGAELTDPISRKLQFGPTCRAEFGL